MLRQLWDSAIRWLPSQCAVCHAWPSRPLCDACVAAFAAPQPRCQRCALRVPTGVAICGACRLHPPPLDQCLAAVSYDYPWAEGITQFKFHQQTGWAASLATLLRAAPWVEPAVEQAHWLIPLPLSPQRLAQRGYNQALLLAQQLAPHKTRADLLLRVQDTAPQSSLKRAQRLANVQNAFAVEPALAASLQGRRLLLVDDVMTSGASLFAAARCLRAAGAAHITAVVVARTDA